MFGYLSNTNIKGIYTVVPANCTENRDCAGELTDRELKKQIKVTGIERRHLVAGGQTSSDLCTLAAERLMKKLGWERDSIRVLLYVTQTPDFDRPSTAFLIQKRLKLSKDCLVFDVNMGCSGYLGGMVTIASILQTCGGRGLLLVGDGDADLERSGKGENLLMGDAGSATALQYCEEQARLPYSMYSDGSGYKVLMKKKGGPVEMNAAAVFSFAINEVTECIHDFKEKNALQEDQIDLYVFHQAQKLILDSIVEICHLPEKKILMSMRDYGNTIGASIPLTLCRNREKLAGREKVRVLLCGFGIGLSWGCLYVEMDSDTIFELEESGFCYDDRS